MCVPDKSLAPLDLYALAEDLGVGHTPVRLALGHEEHLDTDGRSDGRTRRGFGTGDVRGVKRPDD